MVLVSLSSKEVLLLEHLLTSTDDPRQWQRAQALLWLDEGDSVEEVADRLRVTRQSIYNWCARFNERASLEMVTRLADQERGGRPCTARGVIDSLLDAVIDQDPRDFGYRSTIWTASLLQQYLTQQHHLTVCTKSVNRALTRLQIVWKRPRHKLALRHPFWRQAKGG
jgi:transposase